MFFLFFLMDFAPSWPTPTHALFYDGFSKCLKWWTLLTNYLIEVKLFSAEALTIFYWSLTVFFHIHNLNMWLVCSLWCYLHRFFEDLKLVLHYLSSFYSINIWWIRLEQELKACVIEVCTFFKNNTVLSFKIWQHIY